MLFNNISGFLSDSVGNNYTNNEEDVLKTRENISQLVPEYNEENDIPFITGKLDKAIKIFQKNNGLKIDGKMNPAGETERVMFEKLENKPSNVVFGEQYDDQAIGFGAGRATFDEKLPERPYKHNKIQSGLKDISTLMKLAKVDGKYTKILDTASDVLDIPVDSGGTPPYIPTNESKENKYDVTSILNQLKQQQAVDEKSLKETSRIERDDGTFMLAMNGSSQIPVPKNQQTIGKSVSKSQTTPISKTPPKPQKRPPILTNVDEIDIVNHIKEGEKPLDYIYKDSVNKLTVGTGFLINNVNEAKNMPFILYDKNDNPLRPATDKEIEGLYNHIKSLPDNNKNKANKKASEFKPDSKNNIPNIRLDKNYIEQELIRKLRQSSNELRIKFPNFDQMTAERQTALMDMQYNLGGTKFVESRKDANGNEIGWPDFFKAVRSGDWATAAKESKRGGISDERNDETYDLFN